MGALEIACRLTVAVLLATASVTKLAHPRRFFVAIRSLKLVSPPAAAGLTILVPSLELVFAILLVLGGPLSRWAALGAALLFGGFAAVMAVTIRRGVTDADCGCFGGTGRPSWSLVARNVALMMWTAIPVFPGLALPFLLMAVVAGMVSVFLAVFNRRSGGALEAHVHS